MKIPTMLIMVLIVSAIIVGFSFIMADMDQTYIDSGISDAEPLNSTLTSGNYNYVGDINSTMQPLMNALNDIQDTETGWWPLSAIISGVELIPIAVFTVLSVLIDTSKYFMDFIGLGILTTGLPGVFTTFFLVGLMIVVAFKFLAGVRRYDA